MYQSLDVYLHGRKAGNLLQGAGMVLAFKYDKEYISSGGQSLSLSLPLQEETYETLAVRAFFSGLLPDEIARQRLAKYLGVSEKNPFALLEVIGGECAGAVSLWPAGDVPTTGADGEDEILSPERLKDILDLLKSRPLLAGDDGLRLSLAGAQAKIAVGVSGENIVIMKGNRATTHILKPLIKDIEGIEDSVHNEVFCMRLAAKLGINTPRVQVMYSGDVPFFLVERYDRVHRSDGIVIRIHQEDFCQVLGLLPEMKYEREGGPKLSQCMDIVAKHSYSPAVDQIRLLERVIFNYLIGNSDAHGKNFSLLYKRIKPDLSPAYDILSTAVYPSLSSRMAMQIGGKYKPDEVYTRHWLRLVPDGAAAKRNLKKMLIGQIGRVRDLSRELKVELEQECVPSGIYEKIIQVIDNRARHIMKSDDFVS